MTNATQKIEPNLQIALQSDSVLDVPPSIILYGPPGALKTTEVATSFKNLFWITTEPDALRYFESQLRDNPDLLKAGYKMPARKYLPPYEADAKTLYKTKEAFRAIMDRVAETIIAGKFEYDGVAIDQYNTLADRVFAELQADASFGKNKFARINAIKSWNSWVCAFPRSVGKLMVCIAHEATPKYDEEDESPTKGQLLYKGGPAFPIGTERETMAAQATIVIRTLLEGPPSATKRVFMTRATQLWHAKFRDSKIQPRETESLRELLIRAGYKV